MGRRDGPDVHGEHVMAESEITVGLRPHIGIMRVDGQTIEVEHPQFLVLASIGAWFRMQHIGFIGKQKNSLLACLPVWDKIPGKDKDAILSQVSELVGWDAGYVPPLGGRRHEHIDAE